MFCSSLDQWWFQNRSRRTRHLGSSRAAALTRQAVRLYRRASPYFYPTPKQGKKSIEK